MFVTLLGGCGTFHCLLPAALKDAQVCVACWVQGTGLLKVADATTCGGAAN